MKRVLSLALTLCIFISLIIMPTTYVSALEYSDEETAEAYFYHAYNKDGKLIIQIEYNSYADAYLYIEILNKEEFYMLNEVVEASCSEFITAGEGIKGIEVPFVPDDWYHMIRVTVFNNMEEKKLYSGPIINEFYAPKERFYDGDWIYSFVEGGIEITGIMVNVRRY